MTRDRRRRLRISQPTALEHAAARQALHLLSEVTLPRRRPLSRGTFTSIPPSGLSSDASSRHRKQEVVTGKLTITHHKQVLRKKASSTLAVPPKNVPAAPPPALTCSTSRRKSIDAETASMYSSMSAPLDYHEKLFNTPLLSLDPSTAPSALRWITSGAAAREPIKYPTIAHKPPSHSGSVMGRPAAFTTPEYALSPLDRYVVLMLVKIAEITIKSAPGQGQFDRLCASLPGPTAMSRLPRNASFGGYQTPGITTHLLLRHHPPLIRSRATHVHPPLPPHLSLLSTSSTSGGAHLSRAATIRAHSISVRTSWLR